MYNKGLVIAGVVIFVVLALIPFWYNRFTGNGIDVPQFKVPGESRTCVETTSYMRSKHMKLLNIWREDVVRRGLRTYTSIADGRTYEMSLTGTCIKCHSNKEDFCDKCHGYDGVKPNCWDCHVYEKGGRGQGMERDRVQGAEG
jgi:hypothetical protein